MSNVAAPLKRPRLDEDVVPFTEYRRTLNDCFERTARTHRPVIITQNGRATFATMSIADLEATWDEIDSWHDARELSRDISISRREFAEGKGISFEESKRQSLEFLNSLKRRGIAK